MGRDWRRRMRFLINAVAARSVATETAIKRRLIQARRPRRHVDQTIGCFA
jgi:hypothetical protein